MLTHVHYGETLYGWQYRSKGEVKGVETLVTGMTGRVRCSALGAGRAARLTGLWLGE
jgi:hypothetical protein